MLYNDSDPAAARWLRSLVASGLLPTGEVDERKIEEVEPDELRHHRQVHLFAGIGGWPRALHLARVSSDAPVWTGSCPCQPFSSAGKRRGAEDERHLWPEMLRLIRECRPPVVFGEQVASPLGRRWLAGVRADLEELGYGVGAADLCAASVGAPHIRQRLFWVAYAWGERRQSNQRGTGTGEESLSAGGGGVDDSCGERPQDEPPPKPPEGGAARRPSQPGGRLAHPAGPLVRGVAPAWNERGDGENRWLFCRDGKLRRTESGVHPLAHGVSARVDKLRGLGNAIVPQVAAVFVRAALAHLRAIFQK